MSFLHYLRQECRLGPSYDQALGEGHALPLPSPVMVSPRLSLLLERVSYGAFFRLGVAKPGEEKMRAQ